MDQGHCDQDRAKHAHPVPAKDGRVLKLSQRIHDYSFSRHGGKGSYDAEQRNGYDQGRPKIVAAARMY
jgi:hypothetical protein